MTLAQIFIYGKEHPQNIIAEKTIGDNLYFTMSVYAAECTDKFFEALLVKEQFDLKEKPSGEMKASEISQSLALTREQMKSFTLTPFSSSLGLDDSFPSIGTQNESGQNSELLRKAQVCLHSSNLSFQHAKKIP